mmetsp:Transcript_22829/g.37161  ORF Transcript_22829/g.37161 Transcript_22829/m.37161 type:complete len:84 (-) Transcript_22829:383-634(-)
MAQDVSAVISVVEIKSASLAGASLNQNALALQNPLAMMTASAMQVCSVHTMYLMVESVKNLERRENHAPWKCLTDAALNAWKV